MTGISTLEVIIQTDRNDIYRANVDIALGKLNAYRWLTFGVSSGMLSAMFSWSVASYFQDFAEPPTVVLFGGLLGVVIVPSLFIVAIHVRSRNSAESLLQNAPALKGPTRWVFSDNGIVTDGPTSRAEIQWSTFQRVQETKGQYLLYPQDGIACVIPKRCFQAEVEIRRLREMIRRRVPTAKLQSSDA